MGFTKLKLDKKILKALEDAGYSSPTKIQEEAIPLVIDGVDIRASAQTGTGKTAAFLLPALNMLTDESNRGGKGAKILVLTPTRELAQQITIQAEKYSKHMNQVRSVCIVGGVPYHKQQSKLTRPHDILIATPGRLMDYMNRGKINLSNLKMVILDEADRMLDMGFSESVQEILSKTPTTRQTLLFSATLEGEVLQLSNKFMKDPVEIKIHSAKEKHENIEQKLIYVDNLSHKNALLDYLLNAEDLTSAIVFTATKRHCDELVDELEEKNFSAGTLHGDMNQRQRTQTLKSLTLGRINILVATDVAARGIDIPNITHIINYDLPRDVEDYVHRIGRTGRAGKTGTAISFAGSKDMHMVPRIEKYTGQEIKIIEIKGLEAKTKPRASRSAGPSGRSRPQGRGQRSFGGRSDSRGSGDRRSSGGRSDSRDSRGSGDRRDSNKSYGGGRSDSRNSSGSGDRRDSNKSYSGGRSDSRDSSGSGDRRDSNKSYGGGRSDSRDSRGSGDRRDSNKSYGGGRSDSRDSRGSGDRRDSNKSYGGGRSDSRDSRGSGDRRDSNKSYGGGRSDSRDSRGSGDRRDSNKSYSGGRSDSRDSRGSGDRRDSNKSYSGGRSDSNGYGDKRKTSKSSYRGDSPRSNDRKPSGNSGSRDRSGPSSNHSNGKSSSGSGRRASSSRDGRSRDS